MRTLVAVASLALLSACGDPAPTDGRSSPAESVDPAATDAPDPAPTPSGEQAGAADWQDRKSVV